MSKIKTLLAFVALTLCGGAWALDLKDAVVFWDRDFDTESKVGTDGNTFTFNKNGNSVESGCLRISGTMGGLITIPNGSYNDAYTVMIKYSGLAQKTGRTALISIDTSNSQVKNMGLYMKADSTDLSTYWDSNTTDYALGTAMTAPAAGYMQIAYKAGQTFHAWADSVLATTTIPGYNAASLKFSSTQARSFGLGGPVRTSTNTPGPCTDMVIESVAIFKGSYMAVSNTKTTVFPSTVAAAADVTFTPANGADWSEKTLPTKANPSIVTENTSFAGKQEYLRYSGSDLATVAKVTDVASGTYVYGLHAFEGQNGIGAITRDIYLMVSGGAPAVVSGGEDAKWDSGSKTIPTGNVLVNVKGDTTADYVYGAGLGGGTGGSVLAKINGNVGIVVEGNAQVKGSIIAGWQSRHNTIPEVTGNTSILIKNVQTHYQEATLNTENQKCEQGWIAAGGIHKTNGGRSKVGGNASVTVLLDEGATGTFNKNIVAGGIGIGGGDGQNVTGDGTVTITAPNAVTFAKNIVGGGHSTGNNARIGGNTSVTLNGGTYTGTIYAGGDHNAATVGGTATLTINGGVFSGAYLKGGTATGTKKLAFNCDQEFAWANISGFNEIAIAETKKLTMSVSGANDRELTCALTGAGTLEKTGTGTLRVIGGQEGKIIAKGGTLCIKLTVEQQVSGYTSQVTIDGGTLKFVDTTGAELTNGSSDPTVYEMPKNAWNGSAGDGNWDNESNWSYGTVPTASQIIAIESPVTINVTSASVCQQLVVNADAKLVGQIGEGAMPSIIIANEKTLTIEATGESTLNGVSGGTLVKDGSATLNLKAGTGADVSVLANMAVVIKNGKILINQPTGTEAQFHDVAFTIENTACGDDKVPLDCYGWFSATGPWSITTEGTAKVFNNNGYGNTAVIKGSGAFTKLGVGTVVFCSSLGNAGNVYTGTVAVDAGTLTLDPRTKDDRVSTVSGRLTVAETATLNLEAGATFSNNGSTDTADIRGVVNVNGGTTTIKGSDRGFCGTLNVAKDATMKVDRNDFFTYNGGAVTVNVKGTLDFQTNRQTLRNTVAFNFYSGCTVQGYGDNNSNWPCAMEFWNADHTDNIKFLKADDDETGVVTFNTTVGLENSVTFDIADGVTVVCGQATSDENTRNLVNRAANNKTITKAGAGILKITTAYTTPTVLAAGTLVLPEGSTATVDKADVNKKVVMSDPVDGYKTYTLTQRDAVDLYYTEGYFNASSEGNQPTLKAADQTTLAYLTGDTVVIADATGEHPGFSGSELYCSGSAFAKIKIEKDLTIHAGGDFAILGNAEVDVAQGVTVMIVAGSGHTGYTFGTGLTLKGAGKVVFDTVLPTAKVVGNDWTGVCTIKNKISDNYEFLPNNFANANSSIELNGVKLWTRGTNDGLTVYDAKEVIVTDNGETVGYEIYNGYSDYIVKYKKLTGTGTIKSTWAGEQRYVFQDASAFEGSISVSESSSKAVGIVIGTGDVPTKDNAKKKVTVLSGAALNIASGKSVTVPADVCVAGTITGSGTITCNLVLTDDDASVTVASVSGTITTTVDGMSVRVVENGGLKTYTVQSTEDVKARFNGVGYPTVQAAVDAMVAAAVAAGTTPDLSQVTLEEGVEAPGGFKLEDGVLKACDYVVISPNAYVGDWQAYVTARQAMPAAEGLVLGVKNATEIYDAYPYAAGKTDGTPRNAAESIHKWIGIMQKLGTKYFVLGGPWKDARNISESDKNDVIPGITAYPIKPSASSIMNDRPSDLYYACHFFANDQKYVWDPSGDGVYVGFQETNPDVMSDPRHFQPTCVVSRMAFWPGFDKTSKTYADLIAAYKAKLARGEAYDFAGNGYYLTWVDRAIDHRDDGMPDAYDVMADRLHAIANQRTANELLQIAVTKNLTAEELASKKVPLLTHNWEVVMPFGHGTPEGAAGLYGSDYVGNTGLTKFFMASVPCFTGYLGAGDATLAHCALSNPNGGALVSINNTGYGYTTEPGLAQRYLGVSEEMLDYTLDAYVAGATAGEAWRKAISDFAGNVLDPATMAAKLEARGYDGTDATYKIDNKCFVYAAIVEQELLGDPLVAINERDVYVENNDFTTFYTTKERTQTTTLRPTDRIVFDKAAFAPQYSVMLDSAELTGHRIYFAPSASNDKVTWKVGNNIPANQQILIGVNTTLALHGKRTTYGGVIISGEGTLTRDTGEDNPNTISGVVQIYCEIAKPTSAIFDFGTLDSVLKVKEVLPEGMFAPSIVDGNNVCAMCNDFGDAGATYTAAVLGDPAETMKTIVVPEGATRLYMMPAQTADLSAVNLSDLELKVAVPHPAVERQIDLTKYFETVVVGNMLSLKMLDNAVPSPETLKVSMPGNTFSVTVTEPIEGLCYSIVAADTAEGFVDQKGVERADVAESARKQSLQYWRTETEKPTAKVWPVELSFPYDPAKKVQFFKVRVSPSVNYGK